MDRQALKARLAALKPRLLTDKIEDTFGPNPCTSLHLHNDETGETLELACNGKRCVHCGPRKKALIEQQLTEGLGTNAHIARIEPFGDIESVEAGLAAAQKRSQRNGTTLIYQIVGDFGLGWLVVSNERIIPEQRYMDLSDWLRRISDLYHHASKRIRRSYNLGRMSIVHVRRNTKSGQASPWYRRSVNSDVVTEMQDTIWSEYLAESEWREGVLLLHEPDRSLPIPF